MNQVVIVDDDMIVRVTLRSLIHWEDLGFTVAADFNGGKAALEYFRGSRADLLIVDMKMPDLDGISLMGQLQKDGKLPVTVALSGYDEFELVREAFRVGAFDYLLKSDLTPESLTKLLEKLNQQNQRQADSIAKAKGFLADNFANPELTLKSAADYVGLNEKYFSSRFTKEAGITFSAYLTDLRMQRAKQLMMTTDLKMYEISERVGYHNVEHFNRMFKRAMGVSPSDYRRSGGGNT